MDNGLDKDGQLRLKAIEIEVTSAAFENEYKQLQGEVTSPMQMFSFIRSGNTTYLFHPTNLVADEISKAAGTVKQGHQVSFDAEWNHKYNPPKPFATNVRIIAGQDYLNSHADDPTTPTWQRGSPLPPLEESIFEETTGNYAPGNNCTPHSRSGAVLSPRSGGSGVSPRSPRTPGRAASLFSSPPIRRWTRTTVMGDKDRKPTGGLRLRTTLCKFGRKCTRADCWFDHADSGDIYRQASASTQSSSDEDNEVGHQCYRTSSRSGEAIVTPTKDEVVSMGKVPLQLLVMRILEAGKTGYLAVRNTLQKKDYVGRELTREEKASVAELLESMEPTAESVVVSPKKLANHTSPDRQRARVSLEDLCRDPMLHAELSAASSGSSPRSAAAY
jgi:hypothetical protein